MNNSLEDKIREICTYHADEGTSGYYLPEDVFKELICFIEKEGEIAREEERERLEKIIEARLQICQEVNGLPYCKNCGLCPEDIKGRE